MSIEIPHAVLLTGPLADPFAVPAALEPVLLDVTVTLWRTLVADAVTERIDHSRAGLPTGPLPAHHNVLGAAARSTYEQITEAMKSARRDPTYDLSCLLKVLPHPDRDDALLVIVDCEMNEYFDALLTLEHTEPFQYWAKNPDRDDRDDVRAAWDARSDVWERALHDGRSAKFAWRWTHLDDTLAMSLPGGSYRPDPDAVLAAMPTDQTRAKRLASAMVILPPELRTMDRVHDLLRAHAQQAAELLGAATTHIAPITAEDLLAA